MFEFIREIAKQPQKEDTLEALLDVFRDNVAAAFFWAELLRVAAEDPLPFVDRLFELCLAKPIQLGNETVHQLGTFVEVAAKYFSQDQIKALELSFLAIAAGQDAQKNSEFYENRRNRLLTRIPETMLTTENARMIVTELQRKKAVPINAPLVKFESWSEPFDEKEWLKEQGANWRNRANVNMHGYFERLGQFSSKWQNKNPSQDDVTAILPVLREAYELLHQNHGADKPVENTLWTKVGECAETMARAEMNPIGQAFQFCRQTLLECAKHPEPEPDPEYDNKYEFPSWSPAPRNEAAQGLPWLAVWAAGDMEIIQAIGSLLRDPKPSVRFLVTSELWRLRRHYTDQFWLLAEQIAENETNKVVQQALCQTLSHFVAIEEEKTCRLLAKISLIPIEGEDKSNLLDSFVQLVMWLVFVRENGWAQSKAEEFLQNPRKFRKVLSRATLDALSLITPQNIQSNERKKHAERAREWILRAICVAAKELGRFRNLPEGSISEEIRTEVRDIYGVIDEVVMRFYFASGLFEHSKDGPFISADQQREFYFFIKPVLDKVVEVSDYEKGGIFFAPTAHYFMQLLIGVLPHDPKGVLHLANRVASIARGGGYNFDSMAVGEVVKLVEYILANHRIDIRDRESLDDLLGLLDIFADVGWPEALHLVWRLDEVFR